MEGEWPTTLRVGPDIWPAVCHDADTWVCGSMNVMIFVLTWAPPSLTAFLEVTVLAEMPPGSLAGQSTSWNAMWTAWTQAAFTTSVHVVSLAGLPTRSIRMSCDDGGTRGRFGAVEGRFGPYRTPSSTASERRIVLSEV